MLNIPKWLRRFLDNKLGVIGFFLVLVVVITAIFAPLLAPYNPNTQFPNGLNKYGMPLGFSKQHLLGTDLLGRDLLSRIIFGAAIGMIAGYFRGIVGSLLMRFTDVMTAFPALILAIALAALLRPSLWIVVFVIALVSWVYIARAVNALVLSLVEQQFIEAAVAIGVPTLRILMKHVLPQITLTLIVFGTLGISSSVLLAASLSYLGVGVQPPTSSWGGIITVSQSYLTTTPWLVIFPGLAIIMASIGFNLFGEALQDALDVGGRR